MRPSLPVPAPIAAADAPVSAISLAAAGSGAWVPGTATGPETARGVSTCGTASSRSRTAARRRAESDIGSPPVRITSRIAGVRAI